MNSMVVRNPAARQAATRLAARQQELRALLQAAAGAAVGASEREHEVLDFKDVAAEESRAAVDDIATSHATQELAQIAEALRRIDDGSYGLCEDCGDAIDERRLAALPATAFCTSCQTIHERPAGRR